MANPTLLVITMALAFCCTKTDAGFSLMMQKLHSSLKESLYLLESIRDESFAEADLLSGLGRPSSCAELLLAGQTSSGVYTIYPRSWYKAAPFQVYCDMETDGGGWTVFQRRDDIEPRENFYRNWTEYQRGFGNLSGEFWLGNEHLYILTNQDHVSIRIYLEDFNSSQRYALYEEFQIADEEDDYRARISKYKGDAGNGLNLWNGTVFVTHDRNDVNSCALKFRGGWWYTGCHAANLNGLYLKGEHKSYADGVNWVHYKGQHYSLKKSEMKIRPTHFLKCVDSPTFSVTPL